LRVFVTKADGSKQLYSREKVEKTCLRMGVDEDVAKEVAERIERSLYFGIPTNKLLQMIYRALQKYKPAVRQLYDVRKGISLMDSKPEFELFIQTLLGQNGFDVNPNQILRGNCVEHEVDAIAKKDWVTFFVEIKHHFGYHTLTGLDESRIARAILEDVAECFALGKIDLKIDRAMIVTNTRYSEHAQRYGKCRNILQIGWDSPQDNNLRSMIEKKKLYPLSCLRSLKHEARARLVNCGVILIKQLAEEDAVKLARKTMLPLENVRALIEKAKMSMDELWYSRE